MFAQHDNQTDELHFEDVSLWDFLTVEDELHITVVNVTDALEFFDCCLPSVLSNQAAVDEYKKLEISNYSGLRRELSRPHNCLVDDLLISLYSSAYVPVKGACRAAELCKSLLHLTGFGQCTTMFIDGPMTLRFNLGFSAVEAYPKAVVETANHKIVLVVDEDVDLSEFKSLDSEAQLVAMFLGAFKHNLMIEDETPGAMFGIIVSGSKLTFYRAEITQDLGKRLLDSGRLTEDDPFITIKRYSVSEEGYRALLVEDKGTLFKTLQCLEAMRVNILSEV